MKFEELVDINPITVLRRNAEYPFIEMSDISIGGRYVISSNLRQYTGGGAKFCGGDVLFARITPCLENGKIAQFKTAEQMAFGSTEFIVLRGREGISDQGYIFYLALSDFIRKPAEKSMSGASGRQRADLNVIKKIVVPEITLPNQRKIAAILSSYDDLTENNLERIKILEEMAQNLYHEWFVNFHFPGHEKIKFVDSQLGMIPERWVVKNLGELLSFVIGGGWGEASQNHDELIPGFVIRGTDIPEARYSNVDKCPLRFHKPSNIFSRKIEPLDIVFEVSGGSKDQPLGRALLVGPNVLKAFDNNVICASFCKLIRTNQKMILPELLYLHFQDIYSNRQILKYQVQSTGISNFKFTYFQERELILVPPSEIQDKFKNIVRPIFNAIQTIGLANTNLRKTRDLLLPKLISSEIDVSDLDSKVRDHHEP